MKSLLIQFYSIVIINSYVNELFTRKLKPTYKIKRDLNELYSQIRNQLKRGIPKIGEMHKIIINTHNSIIRNEIVNVFFYENRI